MVATLAIIESYIRCLVVGVEYKFFLALPIAVKSGAIAGIALVILTFIGAPKSKKSRKK